MPGLSRADRPPPGRRPRLAAALRLTTVAVGLAFPIATSAETVQVTSPDGRIEITGEVLGFDGVLLRLATPYGPISVVLSEVECDGAACPSPEGHIPELRLSGAPAVGEILLPALVEGFARRSNLTVTRTDLSDARFRLELSDGATGTVQGVFDIHLTTTEEGFADLAANEADLVMAVREPRPDELARANEAGAGDLTDPGRAHVLALDALVPVVSGAAPLRAVSLQGLAELWAASAPDWSQLGAAPGPAALHEPPAAEGFSQLFTDRVLTPFEAVRSGQSTHHPQSGAVAGIVARDAGAVGLARYTEIGNARPLALVGGCGRRMSITEDSLKAEDYPLTTPLMLYVPARRQPEILREFLDWLGTPSAELVVRRVGLIDQVPATIPIAHQGERLANAIAALGPELPVSALQRALRQLDGGQRLTTTFRFRGGSTSLDPLSEDSLERLARDLDAGLHAGREILLAGFSDGQGPVSANLDLSRIRAETVRDALLDAVADPDDLRVTALGFGEVLPMACDDTEWGRQANRRVEVWLR